MYLLFFLNFFKFTTLKLVLKTLISLFSFFIYFEILLAFVLFPFKKTQSYFFKLSTFSLNGPDGIKKLLPTQF